MMPRLFSFITFYHTVETKFKYFINKQLFESECNIGLQQKVRYKRKIITYLHSMLIYF